MNKCVARARANAKARRGDMPQGAPILHPFTLQVCAYKDYGDELSWTFGLVGGRCVHVSQWRNGQWCPVNKHALRQEMLDTEDGLFATEVWAVRLADDEPVRFL